MAVAACELIGDDEASVKERPLILPRPVSGREDGPGLDSPSGKFDDGKAGETDAAALRRSEGGSFEVVCGETLMVEAEDADDGTSGEVTNV